MSKIIPFKWFPSAWGLKGKAYDAAEAYYELEGFELEMRLAEINHSDDPKKLAKMQADIRKKFDVITEYEWLQECLKVELSGDDLAVELIKLDIEFEKVEKREGQKKIAAILNEPWVSIVEEGLDASAGPSGFYFVFDWNDQWIALLRTHGYEGISEDELMEKWFTDVCRNEVMNSAPIPFNSSVVYD